MRHKAEGRLEQEVQKQDQQERGKKGTKGKEENFCKVRVRKNKSVWRKLS
jgi:hypothetical protein